MSVHRWFLPDPGRSARRARRPAATWRDAGRARVARLQAAAGAGGARVGL